MIAHKCCFYHSSNAILNTNKTRIGLPADIMNIIDHHRHEIIGVTARVGGL